MNEWDQMTDVQHAPAGYYDRLRDERRQGVERLRAAIIENTKGESMFWLGEMLLFELDKAIAPHSADKRQEDK